MLAWDEETNTLGWYQVTDTIHHTDAAVVHLTIDGEELETTPEHPFYVEGEGWVSAEDLEVGDDIQNAEGSTGEVESIEIEQTQQEMYNLTVDEAHTFYVGEGQWLVHNSNICDPRNLPSLNWLGKSLINPERPGEAKAIYAVMNSPYVDKRIHIPSVHNLSVKIAQSLNLPSSEIDIISRGAFLHDLGKSNRSIVGLFNSAGELTPAQRIEIQKHVHIGAQRLRSFGVDERIVEMALYHHPGYANMPHPSEIAYRVKILTAADVYSAAREIRSYKKTSLGHGDAMEWVRLQQRFGITNEIIKALDAIGGP